MPKRPGPSAHYRGNGALAEQLPQVSTAEPVGHSPENARTNEEKERKKKKKKKKTKKKSV